MVVVMARDHRGSPERKFGLTFELKAAALLVLEVALMYALTILSLRAIGGLDVFDSVIPLPAVVAGSLLAGTLAQLK